MRILPELVILNVPISSEPNMISPALFTGVKPKAFCLLLKIFQSLKVITPVVVVLAVATLITPAATFKFAPACTIPFVAPVAS